MACKITFKFLTESQTGTIGDDWMYSLDAKVFGAGHSHALISEGMVEVPEHILASGTTQPPPGPPEPLVLAAGDAGDAIRVEMRFKAVEVDPLANDTAEMIASFRTTCPDAGEPAIVDEREISIGVEEFPSGIGNAVLKLTYSVTLEHD